VTHAIALDSQALAADLYRFLRQIDPACWRDGLETAAREQLEALRARSRALLERFDAVAPSPDEVAVGTLRERVTDINMLLEEAVPARGLPVERVRSAWNDFRLEVVPAYERLAAALKPLDVHVPSLRPTNYFRNAYHVASGLGVIALVHHVLPPEYLLPVAVVFAALAWTFEGTRRVFPGINRALMWVFSKVAHPHEAFRVNSATWFASAMLVLAAIGDPVVITVALATLAVGDPVAALIGRRYGTIKLVHGRSLQGSLAFVCVAFLAALVGLTLYFPSIALGHAVALAGLAAVAGALAELFARRIDDNLAIPAAAAAAASVGSLLLLA